MTKLVNASGVYREWKFNPITKTITPIGNPDMESLVKAIKSYNEKHSVKVARCCGGEDLGQGIKVGYTIFLMNGWTIILPHSLTGNIF